MLSVHSVHAKNGFLEQPEVMESIWNVHASQNGRFTSYLDGEDFQKVKDNNVGVRVLPILLYVDDFETANP